MSLWKRADVVALHDYVQGVRQLINGDDAINIPEAHKTLMRGENHEGSNRLNSRVRQLAAWLTSAAPRFSLLAGGPGEKVRRGASVQERFMRSGEGMLARGTPLNRWRQQFYRDIAEAGVGVVQLNPRKDYYLYVREKPSMMADGSLLSDVIHMRRVDPATFAWVEVDDGSLGLAGVRVSRSLGEIAVKVGLEAAQQVLGFWDFGKQIDPDAPEGWDPALSVEVAEIWGSNNGGLVVTGCSPGRARAGVNGTEHIIARWPNLMDGPPFQIAAAGTWPWHSPLDEMIQLTNGRNFWATMLDIQASGAIFRHWQLVDTNTGQDVTDRYSASAPEHLRYDLSKPPPNMGPNTEWKLAPFEFHDVRPRYEEIRAQHEMAGSSVARLIGQGINQNTAVGTGDMIDDAAKDEFADWLEAIESSIEERWAGIFRWHRDHHKDRLIVFDMKRDDDEGDFGSFLNVTTELQGADIVSLNIDVKLDSRSRMQKIADFRFAVEKISNGFSDFDREVEQGNIPGVDDSESEKLAIFVSEAERIEAQVELMAFKQQALQNSGLMPGPDQQNMQPRFLQGQQVDPRGTGTGRGPGNVSDSALAQGATDAGARRVA